MRRGILLLGITLLLATLAVLGPEGHAQSSSGVPQYYVSINYPMWGEVNGTPTLVKSGFYPAGTVITLPKENYTYLSPGYRLLLIPNVTFVYLKSNVSIFVKVQPQYLLNVSTAYPLTVLINGSNASMSGPLWINASTQVVIPPQVSLLGNGERAVLLNPGSFVVNAPRTYKADWQLQYYVNVSSPYPVLVYVNGILQTLTSGWLPGGTKIVQISPYYYLTPFERVALSPVLNLTLNSPLNYAPEITYQFLVELSQNVTVPALVNGKASYLSTGWFDQGTQIEITAGPTNVSKGVQFYITNANPASFTVDSYVYVRISGYYMYFVNLTSPLNGTVNGVPGTVYSGWYKRGTVIVLNETVAVYPNGTEIVLEPSLSVIYVDSPKSVEVTKLFYYYLNVSTGFPLKAFINGYEVTLKSQWVRAGTNVTVPPQYYYVNSTYRLELLNPEAIRVTGPTSYVAKWSPEYLITFNASFPVNVTVNNLTCLAQSLWVPVGATVKVNPYVQVSQGVRYQVEPFELTVEHYVPPIPIEGEKQFAVTLNGNVQWVDQGAQITLYQPIPFYETGLWVGTLSAQNGQIVTDNSPLNETLVTQVNYQYALTGFTFIASLVLSGLTLALRRR